MASDNKHAYAALFVSFLSALCLVNGAVYQPVGLIVVTVEPVLCEHAIQNT